MARWIGWLLGLDRVASVESVRASLGAEWATRGSGPFWFCCAVLAIAVLVAIFYLKYQRRGSAWVRRLLAASRITLLLVLLITLAEPMLRITVARRELPNLFVVFDGTASMEIRDRFDAGQLAALAAATGLESSASDGAPAATRQEYVRAWLQHENAGALARLAEEGKCHLRVFLFDGQTSSHLRQLYSSNGSAHRLDREVLSAELTTGGQVTALGTVLRELVRQPGAGRLAGVVLVSDFVQNSGEHPLGAANASAESAAEELGVPMYTIGVGAGRSKDLAVDLETDPKIRRGEKTTIFVKIRQADLDGEKATLRLSARPITGESAASPPVILGERQITLEGSPQLVEFPFIPDRAGNVELLAEAQALPGESVAENNQASRRIQIIDDFIRLLYVAYEPSWEWRFVKEVFHRDPAVGLNGFRTYLASSDPRVRQSNPLFLPTLVQERAEFFSNDVIFLDDMPSAALSARFCEMVEQFVRELGGGLVVVSGPRFGPNQLANTPLAKMLPVIVDPHAQLRDRQAFRLKLTSRSREYPFMQLDADAERNAAAWDNLGLLPWYQPVANKHERAVVLAEHPTDTCLDGKTLQPLIAMRRYGEGEVIYLGFNEMWRLRRRYGEKYYRRFWLPIIDRLGLSHALGAGKRFVVRMDRSTYRADDEAILTAQVYDHDYEPLEPDALAGESLEAEVVRLDRGEKAGPIGTLRVGAIRAGIFETRFPVYAVGRYRARVKDPLTDQYAYWEFDVTSASAELRSSVRDETLQQRLATTTHGRSGTLVDSQAVLSEIELRPYNEIEEHAYALWTTPFWFAAVVVLMLSEWAIRKWVHLV